jgi:collagenase-like PrtC family protease
VRIITGISNSHTPEEIEAYSKAGVDEFFIGYIPKEWSDEYGWELSSNRRFTSHHHYKTKEELANIVDLIRQNNRKVYLTVNAHDYNSKQLKVLLKILDNIREIKFDGFIVSNLAIILELQKHGFDDVINISIGGGSNNIETIQFFHQNFENIGRIILPRKLTISEIEKIATYSADNNIRLEAFGMAAYCVFNDEFCFTWHSATNRCFCQSPMYEFREVKPLIFGVNWKQEILTNNIGSYYARIPTMSGEIANSRNDYLVKHPKKPVGKDEVRKLHILTNLNKCGLCAFKYFKEWGIEAVKIPLRGQGFQTNISIIELAKKTIDAQNATPEYCQSLMNSPNFCSGSNCYYDYPYAK